MTYLTKPVLAKARREAAKPVIPRPPSLGEETFALHCVSMRLPQPTRELMFAKGAGRIWRFDFAWPDYLVAIEIEGGTSGPGKSRHTTGSGFAHDCEKYNFAALHGWMVLRFTTSQVRKGRAIAEAEAALIQRGRVSTEVTT